MILVSIIFISLIWLGMLIGVSFIATPIKFSAASLSYPTALEVGRVTFSLFSKVEISIALVLFITCLLFEPISLRSATSALLTFFVLTQAFLLLPALDERVQMVMEAQELQPSIHHMAYASCEAVKVLLLLFLSINAVFVYKR